MKGRGYCAILVTSSVLLLCVFTVAAQTDNECLQCSQYPIFQNRACSSDWVLYVKVIRIKKRSDHTRVTIKVLDQFKPNPAQQKLDSKLTLIAPVSTKRCYYSLRENTKYVLSGRGTTKLTFDVCSSVRWDFEEYPLNGAALDNIKTNFLKNCQCQIQIVPNHDNNLQENDKCLATNDELECINHHTFCQYDKTEDTCYWPENNTPDDLDCPPSKNWAVSGMAGGQRSG